MSGLTPLDLTALTVAAVLVGFAKTGVGGVVAISVAVFATVLPARESTGALLPLLLVGDLVDVRTYRARGGSRTTTPTPVACGFSSPRRALASPR